MFWASLDIVYFKTILNLDSVGAPPWVLYAFVFFMVICGGVIWLQMLWYMIFPPLMVRIDEKGITFMTSMRYGSPYFVPGKWVKGCSYMLRADLTSIDPVVATSIEFDQVPELPSYSSTPMGIGYWGYRLIISFWHRDQKDALIRETVKKYQDSRAWDDPERPKRFFQSVDPNSKPVSSNLP
jgi:hypothetical protein